MRRAQHHDDRQRTTPEGDTLTALQPWLAHRGILLDEVLHRQVHFVHDPGGMCLEWYDTDGMRYEDFLETDEWDEADALMRRAHP